MDPLASITLLNRSIDANMKREVLSMLKRAESNRVLYLLLEKLSEQFHEKKIIKELAELKMKKKKYEEGANKLLQELMESDISFLVIKNARYPHLSFDIDLLFRSLMDFEKSIPALVRSSIRPDPHVSGLREYKGATIVLPVEEVWERRKIKKLFDVEVYVPSEEDETIIFLLHMIKHREVFLGDLISLTQLKAEKHMLQNLLVRYKLRIMFSFVAKMLKNLGLPSQGYELQFAPLDLLTDLLAEKKSKEYFPVSLPKSLLYLTCLRLV